MDIDDAYSELGLRPGASAAAVKAAWRRLVSHWHPDRNPAAEAAALMQRINAAYDRIRLATVREAGADDGPPGGDAPREPASGARPHAREAREARGGPAGAGAGANADAGASAGPRAASGTDSTGSTGGAGGAGSADADGPPRVVRRRVRLSLEEAVRGATRSLRGRLREQCGACAGSGHAGEPLGCATCRGSGQRRSDWWVAWPPRSTPCEDCGGTGLRQQPCPVCEGAGALTRHYCCTVRLPPGLRDGDRLSADGGGGHRGGFDGRLALEVRWTPHPLLRVDAEGLLRSELPVDGCAWLAERWVEVPSPTGALQMRLRRGRLVYRLPGQGLPQARGADAARGDLVVTVRPVFAPTLDAEQQALLERLAAIAEAHPPPALRAWQQRLQAWRDADAAGA
ncbi:MAG: hypothetical protein RIQ53_317 [Pseudomonadota bacterium]